MRSFRRVSEGAAREASDDLEEELGNHDAARETYQRYLDRWGESDLAIPEVLQAKARLAAL